jgi:hypothetical protein
MKLGDFFLPKIARSDPKVRKEAVLQEHDAQLLKKVAEKDESQEVRATAKKRLKELASASA